MTTPCPCASVEDERGSAEIICGRCGRNFRGNVCVSCAGSGRVRLDPVTEWQAASGLAPVAKVAVMLALECPACGQLPWRDEMGNDRGTAAGSATVYETRIAALEERDALRDSVALSRSKALHEAEGERDRLRERNGRLDELLARAQGELIKLRLWLGSVPATTGNLQSLDGDIASARCAALAAIPHTEGEASAPPKETTT